MTSEGTDPGLESFGWDELVGLKRKLAAQLKDLTDKIVDIDNNRYGRVTSSLRENRNSLDSYAERLRNIRGEIEKRNGQLLAVSEKISQSKNFLSIMEARLSSESEEELKVIIQKNQAELDAKRYRSEREKNEVLSTIKDASMKIEAIKATLATRDRFARLNQESMQINNTLIQLAEEQEKLKSLMSELNSVVDTLYESKRILAVERGSRLAEYDRIAKQFDQINTRLDAMSEMRRKQRQEYGRSFPSDVLFRVKESARKKLESGAKLSFDELKLLYGEKD